MTETCIVLTTIPSETAAHDLAQALVAARLAACVQITAVHSVYRWQDAVEQAREWQLQIKTTPAHWPALQALVRAQHPYELPELLCLPVAGGDAAYLAWVAASCGPAV